MILRTVVGGEGRIASCTARRRLGAIAAVLLAHSAQISKGFLASVVIRG